MLDDFFTYFILFIGLTALMIIIIFFGKIGSYIERIFKETKKGIQNVTSSATTGASDFGNYLHIPELRKIFVIFDIFILFLIFMPFMIIIFMWIGWYPREDYIALLIEKNLPIVVFIFLSISFLRGILFLFDYILYEVK